MKVKFLTKEKKYIRTLWLVEFEDGTYLLHHDEGASNYMATRNIHEAYLFNDEQIAYFFTKKFGRGNEVPVECAVDFPTDNKEKDE